MKFSGFVGPTYQLDSVNVDCQSCINLIPELIESGTAKEGAKFYYTETPGLTELFNVGDGPIRLILKIPGITGNNKFPNDRFLVVSGNKVFRVTRGVDSWTVVEVQAIETIEDVPTPVPFTMDTDVGRVSGKASPFEASWQSTIPPYEEFNWVGVNAYFADGEKLYSYQWVSFNDGDATEKVDVFNGIRPSHVEMIDGYYIVNEVGTSRFYASDWNSMSFDPLSFASAEGDPDNMVAIASKNRELWLFNEFSTEVFYNSGNADFPFERTQGGFIEKGCLAPYSVAKIEGALFWLGRDHSGQGIVYMAQGMAPQRISTHAIEQAISKYAEPSKANGYCYQQNGHSYYVLNFAENTWVYDLSTGMWHERAYLNDGELERHRADNHLFFQAESLHLVGDYENNKVYALDLTNKSDNGNPIKRLRRAPHVSGSSKRVRHNRLTLDIETGIGLDGDVQGSDPQVVMRFSNDGGHTWSSESWASAGKKVGGIGDFKKRVVWDRLGSARDRVYEISVTDPVRVKIIGAELDVEVGNS